jgi:hypothetical protein
MTKTSNSKNKRKQEYQNEISTKHFFKTVQTVFTKAEKKGKKSVEVEGLSQ